MYNLFRTAWPNATGPKTAEGKKRVSLNGWKDGRFAQPHLLPPAKPGKFPECKNCPELAACKGGQHDYCIKQTEHLAAFLEAFESGNVDAMREMAAMAAAKTNNILHQMLNHIISNGVMLKVPVFHEGQQIGERDEKNMLLKDLVPLINALGFNSAEQLMTPKAAEEQEALTGHLAATQTEAEDAREYRRKLQEDRQRILDILEKKNEQKAHKNRVCGGEGDPAIPE